jgi:hypothetical protein
MLDVISREAVYLWHFFSIQFEQIFLYWAVGIVIGSSISVFGKQKIHKLLTNLQSKRIGIFGIIPAGIIGIISPLCMYGTIPIAASFSEKGVKDDWLAAFMMCSILLNPQLIIYSTALGAEALAIRLVSCFLCGICAALSVRFFCKRKGKSFFNFSGFSQPENRDTAPNPALRLLKNIWRNVKVTAPYFLIGVAISAIFQRYVPENLTIALFGNNKAFGTLMAATIGVPMYVCGGGTIPLLRWWLADGMSLGAACAFMISGPATKITNLSALKIVLGAKNFALYILFVMVFALVSGFLVNLFF